MLTLRLKDAGGVTCLTSQGSLQVFPSEAPKKDPGDKQYALLSAPRSDVPPSVISWPGEYDYGGLSIRGIGHMDAKAEEDQTSYVLTTEGMRCAFLSSPLQELSDAEKEMMGEIDVLVFPAEDAKRVQTIVEEIDPPVVVPLRGKDAKGYQEALRACGAKDAEPVKEVKLKKSGLPTDARVVYVLEE